MAISCDVILDPGEVNVWLVKHGHSPVHDFLKRDGDIALLERSEVTAALLGDHHEGIANIILCRGRAGTLTVSLALLENICAAMRAQAGPDPRLVDEADIP